MDDAALPVRYELRTLKVCQ